MSVEEKIAFLDIEKLIMKALEHIEYKSDASLEEIFEADIATRNYVNDILKGGF